MKLSDAKYILLPRFDTHGDHVLLSGFLNALIDLKFNSTSPQSPLFTPTEQQNR